MSLSIKRVVSVLALSTAAVSLQAAELNSLDQKFSYALGFQFAQQLKAQDVAVDSTAFAAALDDVLKDAQPQLSVEEMSEAFRQARERVAKAQAEKAEVAQKASEAFLAENGKKKGVVTLPSGLQYQIMKKGSGEEAGEDATVTVHYKGSLINGKQFDSSYDRGQPASFALNGVVPGFREGISKMKQGGKWKLFIPAKLGYGDRGAPGAIGPNEALVFEVELISIDKSDG